MVTDEQLVNARSKAAALERLICEMLRGTHTRSMSQQQLALYVQEAGVALHNLPYLLAGEELREEQLDAIDRLDPNRGSDGQRGPWAAALATAFGFDRPGHSSAGHKV